MLKRQIFCKWDKKRGTFCFKDIKEYDFGVSKCHKYSYLSENILLN